ncbi:hypothetical protein, partial [Zoogloea sp.]|uniref:hypothetical protein n=1 Tax=Zoogloea sp. TaxID=49181 RepID=UPI0035B3B587
GQRHGHVDTALQRAHGNLIAHENSLIGLNKNALRTGQETRSKTCASWKNPFVRSSEKPLV